MAENYREGDLPIDAAGQAGEGSEAAGERFQENLKKTQAAAKAAKQDERKARVFDNTLAAIVTKLLQDHSNNTVVVLIVGLVESNVPSDFLLSILSLYIEEAHIHVKNNLQLTQGSSGNEKVELISLEDVSAFPIDLQVLLRSWGDLVNQCAFKDGVQVLETMIEAETWEIHPSLIALSAQVIVRFAEQENISVAITQAQDFSKIFFQKLLDDLQSKVS
jgi:hypothetical protein